LSGYYRQAVFKYDESIQCKQTLEPTRLLRVRFATIRNLYADISFFLMMNDKLSILYLRLPKGKGVLVKKTTLFDFFYTISLHFL
jgi:hypothetical protein